MNFSISSLVSAARSYVAEEVKPFQDLSSILDKKQVADNSVQMDAHCASFDGGEDGGYEVAINQGGQARYTVQTSNKWHTLSIYKGNNTDPENLVETIDKPEFEQMLAGNSYQPPVGELLYQVEPGANGESATIHFIGEGGLPHLWVDIPKDAFTQHTPINVAAGMPSPVDGSAGEDVKTQVQIS